MFKSYFWVFLVILALLLAACAPEQARGAQAAQPLEVEPAVASQQESAEQTPDREAGRASCPVTASPEPAFVPPEPYPPAAPESSFWFGSQALWTAIPQDGVWSDLPKNPAGYTQKVPWWRVGYDWQKEPEPRLVVMGRRLDARAEPLKVSQATNAFTKDFGSLMMVGIDFPTPGCWEISGRYADDELSFVVWVEP